MTTDNRQLISREHILKQLKIILEPWIYDNDMAEKIDEQTNLLMDIGVDSVGILQLVLGIEKEFNISIKDHELNSDMFSRMGNLIDIIRAKSNETN
jgi:acyl carrier protein